MCKGLSRLFVLLSIFLFTFMTVTALSAFNEREAPIVRFTKGLLTVEANNVTLESLFENIEKKANIKVSFGENLHDRKIIVRFNNLTIEEGLKRILTSARIENHAIVYRKSLDKKAKDEWVIEEVMLVQEGKRAVITDESIEFFGKDGKVKKRIELLKDAKEGNWSTVTISKNKRYVALKNLYGMDEKESAERGEFIMLDDDGDELWRIEGISTDSLVPSPNGHYLVSRGPMYNGAIFHKDRGVYEIGTPGDDVICMDFSNNGEYFAIAFQRRGILYVITMDEHGNELGQSKGIAREGAADYCEMQISADDRIRVKTGIPDFKVHYLDKRGTILSN